MDIKIVNQEEIKEPQELASPEGLVPDGVMLKEQVAQLFDLLPSELSRYGQKLDSLIAYAKLKTDDHTVGGIKWALKQLGMKLGTPPLGEKSINHLNIYARLYLESVANKQRRDEMLRGEEE